MACNNVYTPLHLGTKSKCTEINDVIELLDDDEDKDLCSTEVTQYRIE